MSHLNTHSDGSILTIELNNPSKKNPLTFPLLGELVHQLEVAANEGKKVAIIKGSGDSFSAGYNIDPGAKTDYVADHRIDADASRLSALSNLLRSIRNAPIAVISQIHGYCVAGGTDLLLSSDIAICAHDAKIGVPNVRSLGITLMSTVWPLLIGPAKSKLMMFTGDLIDGWLAEEWGLAALSVAPEKLESTVLAVARRVALMPSDMLQISKLAMNRALDTAGTDQMLRSAVELDAMAHFSSTAIKFWQHANSRGLKSALSERDQPFSKDSILEIIRQQRQH